LITLINLPVNGGLVSLKTGSLTPSCHSVRAGIISDRSSGALLKLAQISRLTDGQEDEANQLHVELMA